MPNSFLLTLLTTEKQDNPGPITRLGHPDLNISQDAEENISKVFQAISADPPQRNLIKDVARKELYEKLYSIIHKGYEDTPMSLDDQTLNRAIAMALETAIREASKREKEGKSYADDGPIITLRKVLREDIIKALNPK